MIEVTVRKLVVKPAYKIMEETVRLHGFNSLTPRAAHAAVELAFGPNQTGEAWLGDVGYRVYRTSARKITDAK